MLCKGRAAKTLIVGALLFLRERLSVWIQRGDLLTSCGIFNRVVMEQKYKILVLCVVLRCRFAVAHAVHNASVGATCVKFVVVHRVSVRCNVCVLRNGLCVRTWRSAHALSCHVPRLIRSVSARLIVFVILRAARKNISALRCSKKSSKGEMFVFNRPVVLWL